MTTLVDVSIPDERHEIHTSSRKSFKGCRRRYNWIFNEQYYPIRTAKPLEFGTAYHAAMEVYYEPDTWNMDRDVVGALAITKFVDVCEAQKRAALEIKDEQYLPDEVEEDYQERLDLGRGMLRYYFSDVAPVADKRFKPVKVEIPFTVPILNPIDGKQLICECHEWPVTYNGRIDMLAEDDRGDYWIFDWKTAAQIARSDEFLYLDDQIGSYVWALRYLRVPVRGFVYHEQRKAFPQAPTRNTNIRQGRWFSVNKNQATDYDTYLATVQEHDSGAFQEGLYDDFLEFLKEEGTPFWKRYQIHKSDKELISIASNIYYEAYEMTRTGTPMYPNAGRFGCNTCAFRQPCMGMNSGEDYQYTLNTLFEHREHYWLREAPSTESKGGE